LRTYAYTDDNNWLVVMEPLAVWLEKQILQLSMQATLSYA
jgi:hypothetical protein